MKIYEGMFLLDDSRANDNWDAVAGLVRGLLEKHQAQVFTLERWDDRRLAYPIKGHNRAVYLLTRFTAPAEAIAGLERSCQLDETILRVLFTRDLHSEDLHKAGLFPPSPAEAEAPQGQAPAESQAPQDTPAAGPQEQAPAESPAPQDAPAAGPQEPEPEADQQPPAEPPQGDAAPADTQPPQEPQEETGSATP